MATVAYQGQPVSFSSTYGTRPNPSQAGSGPAGCPLTFMFGAGNDGYAVSLQTTFPFGLTNIQTVYIDNSASPARTVITFPLSSETIAAEPFTRGFYPCATNATTFTATNNSEVAAKVTAVVYNFIIPPIVTNATGLQLGSGSQVIPTFAGTANATLISGLNVPFTLAVPGFMADPFYYVTGFAISYVAEKFTTFSSSTVSIYNSFDGGSTPEKVLWNGLVISSTTDDLVVNLANISGLAWCGTGALYLKSVSGLASGFSEISLNIYGGSTNVDFS